MKFFLFASFIIFVSWHTALAAQSAKGVVPNPPPLFQLDRDIKPNLSGSIDSNLESVGNAGTGDTFEQTDDQSYELTARTPTPAGSQVINGSVVKILSWLVLAGLVALISFLYYRWWGGRRGK